MHSASFLFPYQQLVKILSIIQNLIRSIRIRMVFREKVFNTTSMRLMLLTQRNFSNQNSELVRPMPIVAELLNPFCHYIIIFLKMTWFSRSPVMTTYLNIKVQERSKDKILKISEGIKTKQHYIEFNSLHKSSVH